MPDWVFVWPENLERISDTTVRRLFYKALELAEMRRAVSMIYGTPLPPS
jgi:hypothetical protein